MEQRFPRKRGTYCTITRKKAVHGCLICFDKELEAFWEMKWDWAKQYNCALIFIAWRVSTKSNGIIDNRQAENVPGNMAARACLFLLFTIILGRLFFEDAPQAHKLSNGV